MQTNEKLPEPPTKVLDTEFKGTRGKWQTFKTSTGEYWRVEPIGCDVFGISSTDEEREANAKLIAAAPELLNLLIKVIKSWDVYNSIMPDLKNDILSAIKKATS